MGFRALFFCFLLCSSQTLFAFSSPAFKGKANNLTKSENDKITISVTLDCSKVIVDGMVNCGKKGISVTVNDDGTFVIPSITLDVGRFNERYIETYFSISVDGKKVTQRYKVVYEGPCQEGPKCSFDYVKLNLQNFTLIELPTLKIHPVFSSGILFKEFYKDSIYPYLNAQFEEELGDSTIKSFDLSPVTIKYQDSSDAPFVLSQGIQFIPKILEEDDLILFRMKEPYTTCSYIKNGEKIEFQYSVSKGFMQHNFPIEILKLQFNDLLNGEGKSCITSLYSLNGAYSARIQFDLVPGEQAAECNFMASLSCNEVGELSGEMSLWTENYKNLSCPLLDRTPRPVSGKCGTKFAYIDFSYGKLSYHSEIKMVSDAYPSSWWKGDMLETITGKHMGEIRLINESKIWGN